MEGCAMGQVLHGSARTTEAVRRAIQHSEESLRSLAKRFGINQKTVAKWKSRASVTDRRTGPSDPKSTVKSHCDLPGDVSVADAMHDQHLYDRLVNAFSTRSFVPTVAVPTDHDKFFNAFDKFGEVSGSRFVDMVLDQLRNYHSENVQYVEFMVSF